MGWPNRQTGLVVQTNFLFFETLVFEKKKFKMTKITHIYMHIQSVQFRALGGLVSFNGFRALHRANRSCNGNIVFFIILSLEHFRKVIVKNKNALVPHYQQYGIIESY